MKIQRLVIEIVDDMNTMKATDRAFTVRLYCDRDIHTFNWRLSMDDFTNVFGSLMKRAERAITDAVTKNAHV